LQQHQTTGGGDTVSQAATARHLHQALFNLADALGDIDADSIEATKLDTAYRLIEEVERHIESRMDTCNTIPTK